MAKKLEVLISCMHQSDMSIVHKTNILSDAVIINQCDRNSYDEDVIREYRVRMYSCTERGLSRSRNMAIRASTEDICLLCDDDEHLEDDYVAKILKAYEVYPDADVIAFRVQYPLKKCWRSAKRIRYLDTLKIYSWQITFKRESIVRSAILFNELFGAGTKYSHGEENVFLYNCLNNGLKIYYVPALIAVVKQDKSTWFHGFTENYFINRGILTRYYMGIIPATMYAFYFVVSKYARYRKDISFLKAVKNTLKGIYSKKIERPY